MKQLLGFVLTDEVFSELSFDGKEYHFFAFYRYSRAVSRYDGIDYSQAKELFKIATRR